MPTKNKSDAPAADRQIAPVVESAAPRPRRTGLIVGGVVLAAALLFGGGVVLGVNLPHPGGGQPGFSQGQFPGGGMRPGGGQGGPRFGGQQPPAQGGSTGQ